MHLHQILTLLEEDNTPAVVYIEPNDGELTDEDSATEDEAGAIDNLSSLQLAAPAHAILQNGERIGFPETEPAENLISYKTPIWNNELKLKSKTTLFPEPDYSSYRDLSPVDFFELFFDDDVLELMVEQSIVYAIFKGEHNYIVTKEEMKVFLGILIVSGFVPVPSRRMFWETSTLTRNEAVYRAMRRNKFEKIMQYLHLKDNTSLNMADKYTKLRPLITLLTKRFSDHFQPEQSLSHDEAMVEYFGRHGCKQCIRNKPIRFGYKVWCLNTDAGYLVAFDIYQGKTMEVNENYNKQFGKCGATVLKNLDLLPEEKRTLPFNIYFDNLFTSFPLLVELKSRNYGATGTIRENRCKKCPIKTVKEMKKVDRGTSVHSVDTENDIVVCRWMDNAVVTLASTVNGNELYGKVPRYSVKMKKKVEINCPYIVKQYNKHMGGTDRQDQNVNNYRISFRRKKWWWCIFTWLVDVSVQNAWILHQKTGKNLSQLKFREQLAETYLTRFGNPPKGCGKTPTQTLSGNNRVIDDIRYDNFNHLLVPTKSNKRRRCAQEGCNKRPFTECNKCELGLCISCNASFHTK